MGGELKQSITNFIDVSAKIEAGSVELYEEALTLLRTGHKDLGKSKLHEIIGTSPGFSFARSDLGVLLVQDGEVDLGIRYIESACEIDPLFIPFWKNLVKTYLVVNRRDALVPIFSKLVKDFPDDQELKALVRESGVVLPIDRNTLITDISNDLLGNVSEASNSTIQIQETVVVEGAVGNLRGRVAVFYDEPGWAWWHRSHNLKKSLAGEFQIDILPLGSFFDESLYDYCLVYDHCVLHLLPPIPSSKLIIGNSCPKMLPDFIETMRRTGCAAGVVNNKFAFEEACRHVSPVYLCQNGVNTKFFYPSLQIPNVFTACWVGNSGSMGNKGLDLIKEACIKANVNLIFVDAKNNLSSGKRVATQENIRDNVYHKALVYICASEFEGTPNPGLEALSCGLAVISTAVGNMPEVIVDGWNGFIVPRSVEGIAGALETLKGIDRARLRVSARVSVLQDWDWEAQGRKYCDMLIDLDEKKRGNQRFQNQGSQNHDSVQSGMDARF